MENGLETEGAAKNMKNLQINDLTISAFTLPEVTLAIGITAIALVSLMGMIPKGMDTMKRANDRAIEGRIHQQVLAEIQLTSWEGKGGGAPIDVFDRQIKYFDDQGIEMFDPGGREHVYTARITMPKTGVGVPGDSTAADLDYARRVVVDVTSIVDPNFLNSGYSGFDNPKFERFIHTYQTVVTKMGREFDK